MYIVYTYIHISYFCYIFRILELYIYICTLICYTFKILYTINVSLPQEPISESQQEVDKPQPKPNCDSFGTKGLLIIIVLEAPGRNPYICVHMYECKK